MFLSKEKKLGFDDVDIVPSFSSLNSRQEAVLEHTFSFRHSSKTWTGVPIVAANMDTVGTVQMAKALSEHKMLTALHKFYSIKELEEAITDGLDANYVALTTGIREDDKKRLKEFKQSFISKLINIIIVDVPNGYIPNFFDTCKEIREQFPEHIIGAGNMVTSDSAVHLVDNCGVDFVKGGISGGGQCLSKPVTGVAYPQFSMILDMVNDVDSVGGLVMSDGGCKKSGDISKAFSAGASFTMVGSMLGGHDENCSEIIEKDGSQFVKIYGMSSNEAMNKHYGKVADYRASEGAVRYIPYKGSVHHTVHEILGGIRSTMTYIGAKNISEMSSKAKFILV